MVKELSLFDDEGEDVAVGDTADIPSDSASLYEALKTRRDQIDQGIGKRYLSCSKKGPLNVHSDPKCGPYATHNIVGKLEQGQIVTSVGAPLGNWIHHDGGGWSLAKFEGHDALLPIEE
eukprot:CAMPEP_0183295152 /NCGR_PEP_ID=MMETSP0160_2-20130417/3214_1 /TAXON_ID=2839 ORGANISM="Odontella Sinensis, Strain Grunow 1884" /NCGR_SAMPLE_ID=MMETSP0160_2 /ASSEMBLY_ACC=CAM_ASM_000250 /LENGTH=118 /DNA_ID=CAMNT_0025456585 /DNA_START=254 /DNA_END=610 /DNA_ORIENTATION=+